MQQYLITSQGFLPCPLRIETQNISGLLDIYNCYLHKTLSFLAYDTEISPLTIPFIPYVCNNLSKSKSVSLCLYYLNQPTIGLAFLCFSFMLVIG
jgi:hypothetical protein